MRVEANVSLRPRGDGAVRDAGRGQEHELVPLGRAGDRVRDRAPGARRSTPASRSSMETRGWDDGAAGDLPHAGQGDVGRLPLLPGAGPAAAPRRAGLDRARARRRCRSCRRRGGRATRRWGSPRYDAAVLVADPGMTGAFEAISRPPAAALPAKEVANFVTGAHARAAKAAGSTPPGPRARRRPRGSRRSSAAIVDGRVSRPVGRELLERHLADGTAADDAARGRRARPDLATTRRCSAHVDAVIAANPKAVADYRAGKPVDRVLRRPGHEGDRRRRPTRPA